MPQNASLYAPGAACWNFFPNLHLQGITQKPRRIECVWNKISAEMGTILKYPGFSGISEKFLWKRPQRPGLSCPAA